MIDDDYYPESKTGKKRKELLESKRICAYCGRVLDDKQKTVDEKGLRFCNNYHLKKAKAIQIREKEIIDRMSSKV